VVGVFSSRRPWVSRPWFARPERATLAEITQRRHHLGRLAQPRALALTYRNKPEVTESLARSLWTRRTHTTSHVLPVVAHLSRRFAVLHSALRHHSPYRLPSSPATAPLPQIQAPCTAISASAGRVRPLSLHPSAPVRRSIAKKPAPTAHCHTTSPESTEDSNPRSCDPSLLHTAMLAW
jgi:hypothetical protein